MKPRPFDENRHVSNKGRTYLSTHVDEEWKIFVVIFPRQKQKPTLSLNADRVSILLQVVVFLGTIIIIKSRFPADRHDRNLKFDMSCRTPILK